MGHRILAALEHWRQRLATKNIDPEVRLLWVDIAKQCLYVLNKSEISGSYPVSTAANGAGCAQDSKKTPVGLHRIAEKIGDGEASGMIFKGRQPTGEIAVIETGDTDTGLDCITSRILWLSGLEPGLNQGAGVDSYHRYIYIHGTNEEGRIGAAVSHGCVRMKNADIIALFDQVEEEMLVIIE